jgi:hypothetical protein
MEKTLGEKRSYIEQTHEKVRDQIRDYVQNVVKRPLLAPLADVLGADTGSGGGDLYTVQDDAHHVLKSVAEYLIAIAAKKTLTDAPEPWTEAQVERVRAPMLAFGLIGDDELRDPRALRQAVLQLSDREVDPEPSGSGTQRRYFVRANPDAGHLVDHIRTFLIGVIKKESTMDPNSDPRSNLICLTAASRGCYFYETPEKCGDTRYTKCSVTWRALASHEQVKRFRIEYTLDPPASEKEEEGSPAPQTYGYEGILDHGFVRSRLTRNGAPGAPGGGGGGGGGDDDAEGAGFDMRVSDLGITIVNYSISTLWMAKRYLDVVVEPSKEYASGVISSEVLSEQRQKGSNGKQMPPVLKKNKPSKTEEYFKAFERSTCFNDSIAHIIEIYYRLKKLQVDYIVACHICESIYLETKRQ